MVLKLSFGQIFFFIASLTETLRCILFDQHEAHRWDHCLHHHSDSATSRLNFSDLAGFPLVPSLLGLCRPLEQWFHLHTPHAVSRDPLRWWLRAPETVTGTSHQLTSRQRTAPIRTRAAPQWLSLERTSSFVHLTLFGPDSFRYLNIKMPHLVWVGR